MRALLGLVPLLALAGCGEPNGPPLVSTQYPPNTSANAPIQPLNSLPRGTANLSRAPNATSPDFASFGFRAF